MASLTVPFSLISAGSKGHSQVLVRTVYCSTRYLQKILPRPVITFKERPLRWPLILQNRILQYKEPEMQPTTSVTVQYKELEVQAVVSLEFSSLKSGGTSDHRLRQVEQYTHLVRGFDFCGEAQTI